MKRNLAFIFLSLILILAGCSRQPSSQEESTKAVTQEQTWDSDISANSDVSGSHYTFPLFDNGKTYTTEDLKIQKDFESFLAEVFTDSYTEAPITINFLLEHPENYGISKVRSSWTYPDISKYLSAAEDMEETKNELLSFSYDSLTYEQQYIYDNLKKQLETESSFPESYLYSSAFSLDGLPSQLPLIFTEYCFRSEEDIEDYLTLLEDLNSYVASCLDFERYRMSQGYYLSDYAYDSNIEQCETFLTQGETYLSNIFEQKLAEYQGLSSGQKETYLKRSNEAIKNSVLPAYQSMCDELTALKKEGSFNQGLLHLSNGKDYYEYLIKNNVGTDASAKELISLVDENIEAYQKKLTSLVLKNPSLISSLENPSYIYTDADKILYYLSKKLTEDFPAADCGQYTVKEVDAAMSDQLSVAFYLLSPIDNYQNNVIYTNPERIGEGNDLFPTLAHEGFPGHMYQHNYFWSTNPSYFRSLLSFTGYSEGWAEYVECYSYNWSGLDEDVASSLKINTLLSDAIPVRIDLGVNYEGWTKKDTADYLAGFGIENEEAADTYYNTVISAPTVFFTYYIGYLEISNLKQEAMDMLQDKFNLKDFHKFLLDAGPSYFSCIDSLLPYWCERILK